MSNLAPRALIVDDDGPARKALEEILAAAGFLPMSVADGRTALLHLPAAPPDLVITDLVLPDVPGMQIIETVRRIPTLHRCATLALSGHHDPRLVMASFEAGADDFLSKPVSGEELVYRARLAMKRRRELPAVSGKGERRNVSAFFLDVRGFTPIAARMDPESVVELLNGLFDRLANDITLRGGMIDKFMGDGLLALFGATGETEGKELRAIGAALSAVESTAAFVRESLTLHGRPMNVGVGIASGDVVIAPVGSRGFRQVTAIGDAVNLASRLQGVAAEGEVLVCPKTYEQVKHKIEAGPGRELSLKGIAGTPRVHAVRGIRSEAILSG